MVPIILCAAVDVDNSSTISPPITSIYTLKDDNTPLQSSSSVVKKDDAKGIFNAMDVNHDSKLTFEEFYSGLSLLVSFGRAMMMEGGTSSDHSWSLWSWFPSIDKSDTKSTTIDDSSEKDTKNEFWNGVTISSAMIVATEIGDKTFFIAAVLSMRKSRQAVFSGAALALIVMTILSTLMGVVLPSILPRSYTHILGGILFLYFGCKLLLESRSMTNGVSDELGEVEEELLHTKDMKGKRDDEKNHNLELGSRGKKTKGKEGNAVDGVIVADSGEGVVSGSSISYKVFVQSFTLTFLAEWGDRSQIATVALGAQSGIDPKGVVLGASLGHCACTGLAVIGGRMLASKISERTVGFWGGCVFLFFGVKSLFFE